MKKVLEAKQILKKLDELNKSIDFLEREINKIKPEEDNISPREAKKKAKQLETLIGKCQMEQRELDKIGFEIIEWFSRLCNEKE